MDAKSSTPETAFAKILRSFQTGGVAFGDFMAEVKRCLDAGASVPRLADILRRREAVERLPDYAYEAVAPLLGLPPSRDGKLASEDAPTGSPEHTEPPQAAAAPPSSATAPPSMAPAPSPASAPPHPAIDELSIPPEEATIDLEIRSSVAPAEASDAIDFTLEPTAGELAAFDQHGDGTRRIDVEMAANLGDSAYDDPASANAIGAVGVGDALLGRFRLLQLVGEGGMSRVFKASDEHPLASAGDQPCLAVKVLTRPFNYDAAAWAALQAQIQRLRALIHPNIVRMFGCERDGSVVFMTMEYVQGESLYAKLHARNASAGSRGAFDHGEALIAAIGGALDYAHRHGVVHGDLKPGNVLLTSQSEVKVIDFGMAGWLARPGLLPSTQVTPRYASPQLLARQKPEPTDDVYALACLAYEVLTGFHPLVDGARAGKAPVPPPRRPALSGEQYSAILNGMHSERARRTPTVQEFLREFAAKRVTRTPPWRALAAGAALIAVLLGWMYFHSPAAPQAPAPSVTVNMDERAPPAMPVPAPAPNGAPASPSRVQPGPKPGTVLRDCPTCPPMVVIPAGRFQQGSASNGGSGSAFEQPQHLVRIDYPLAVAAHSVTLAEFREFATATKRDMRGCEIYTGHWRNDPKADWLHTGFTQNPQHPVTCTSWNDATAYATWLSAKTGHRYRLPSASEWEYAARAGGEAARPWSPSGAGACANANVADRRAARRFPGWTVFDCDDGYVYTAPVGMFKANAFGLKDMLGNVFQWTQDCWHGDYLGAPSDGSPRAERDCSEHELRGGSWFSSPDYVRATYRNHFPAGYRTSSVGLRLVRELTP